MEGYNLRKTRTPFKPLKGNWTPSYKSYPKYKNIKRAWAASIMISMNMLYRAGASLWVAGVRMTVAFTRLTVAQVESSTCPGVALSAVLKYTPG